MREIWEQLCNFALAREGRSERIDRRTLKAQGIDREPTIHLGPAAAAMERCGVHSLRGDEYRSRRDRRIGKELSALQKVENGVEAARARHALRKQQAAERSRQERTPNRRGMER